MRRFLPTLILIVVCLGVFWYAKDHNYFRAATPAKNLSAMQSANITAFNVQTVSEATYLQETGSNWEMTKPAAYPVEQANVLAWLASFTSLTYDDIIEQNATNLADYGLDAPKQYYKFTLKDGSTKTLLVGSIMTVVDDAYVKWADSPIIYSVPNSSLQNIAKAPFDFVNTEAIPIEFGNVKSIQLTWQGKTWELDKADADKSVYDSTWQIDGKDLPANMGIGILQKITGVVTTALPKSAADVDLTSPDFTLVDTETDSTGKKTITTTYIGKIADQNVWIAKQGGAWVYQTALTDIQALAAANVPPPSPSATPAS